MEASSSESGSPQTRDQAFEATHRTLRRLLRHVKNENPTPDEGLDKLMRQSRRQLRLNREHLGNGAD